MSGEDFISRGNTPLHTQRAHMLYLYMMSLRFNELISDNFSHRDCIYLYNASHRIVGHVFQPNGLLNWKIVRMTALYLAALTAVTHYGDVIMDTMASRITSITIVYSTLYSGADQRQHQSSASLAFVQGIHREPVNSLNKWPVTRKMFPFDDVIMQWQNSIPEMRMLSSWHHPISEINMVPCTL